MKSVLSSIHDLQELYSHKSRLLPWNTQIELGFDGLSEAENLYYQTRLNKFLNSCGCTSGAIFATLCGGLYLLYLVLNIPVAEIRLRSLLTILAIFFAGGIIGKVFGLIYSHVKLKLLIHQLSKRLTL